MKTFTFYEYRQVKMYTKDTFEIEAESMDEAKKKLKDIIKNGDSWIINIDFEYDYESVEDIPNTEEYYDEESVNITKEIK
jgi:hypothetical protein